MCPIRNWVARSPLLRKGAAHTEQSIADRAAGRAAVEDGLDEWLAMGEEHDDGAITENELPARAAAATGARGPRSPAWSLHSP